MAQASFRFYAELNDFLPPELRQVSFPYSFKGCPTVKDAIEALGIPHVEVELIVVNGESVGFGHNLRDGDRVAVYPIFETMDISPLVRVRQEPLRQIRFIADAHLGKLARLLRLLGFDTLHSSTFQDEELVRLTREGRILLTRDRQLLKHGQVTHGYWVRSTDPLLQAQEVVRRFDLGALAKPFSRCLTCNGLLGPMAREEALPLVPPRVREWCTEFLRCQDCGRIFWPGTHYPKLLTRVHQILGQDLAPKSVAARLPFGPGERPR